MYTTAGGRNTGTDSQGAKARKTEENERSQEPSLPRRRKRELPRERMGCVRQVNETGEL